MAALYNLARVNTTTTGTGTITLGSVVSGYLSFLNAGVPSGAVISYGIADGANCEAGVGTYNGTTLTRGPIVSNNSNAAINLSGNAQVYITALNRDFLPTVFATGNTTTDTTAIQNALNTGPGTVWLPSSAYTLNALTIPTGVTLVGAGPAGTVLTANGSPSTFLKFTGSLAQVRDLGIAGTCTAAVGDGGTANLQECLVDRIAIRAGGPTYGVSFTGNGGYYNRIHRSWLNECSTAGVYFTGTNALDCELRDLDIGGNNISQYGVYASGIAFFSMHHVEVLQCSLAGISASNCNFDATACISDTNGNFAWYGNNTSAGPVSGGDGARLFNCWASSSSATSGGANGSGFAFTNMPAQFNGCEAIDNEGYGFLLNGTSGNAIATPFTVSGCKIITNGLHAGHGLYANNCFICSTGNSAISNPGGYGQFFDSGAIGLVGDNAAYNNASGGVHVAGTMTVGTNM